MCGFAGVRWGSGGVWCGTVITVPYIGIVPIRRKCSGDRWGVLRNGHDRSLHGRVRIRLDTVMICGAYCGTARGPFPTLGLCGGDPWGVLRKGTGAVPYGRISYAERELANSRESPMVLFDHRPNRTNCQPALSANFIRRAENSDRSGGFCSPNILHNPPVSNCPRRLAAKKEQTEVCSLNIYRLGDYTSSMIAISAASPRRSPMRMTRV